MGVIFLLHFCFSLARAAHAGLCFVLHFGLYHQSMRFRWARRLEDPVGLAVSPFMLALKCVPSEDPVGWLSLYAASNCTA